MPYSAITHSHLPTALYIHAMHMILSLAWPRIAMAAKPRRVAEHHAHRPPVNPTPCCHRHRAHHLAAAHRRRGCPATIQVGSPPVPAPRGVGAGSHADSQRHGARQATAPRRPCARPARQRPRAAGSRRPWRRAWGCAGTGSPRPRCGTRTTPPASAPGRPRTQTCSCCACTRPPVPPRAAAEHALFVFEREQHWRQALQAHDSGLFASHVPHFCMARSIKETVHQILHEGT